MLQFSRSTLYYEPRPVPAADLAVMRRIDELHLDYPFVGSRMMRDLLRGEGITIRRERVVTMMRRMGIEALYRHPNTSIVGAASLAMLAGPNTPTAPSNNCAFHAVIWFG